MTTTIDNRLIDETMDAYLDWREHALTVHGAYERWGSAPRSGAAAAFREYTLALDREERSSLEYAALLGSLAR